MTDDEMLKACVVALENIVAQGGLKQCAEEGVTGGDVLTIIEQVRNRPTVLDRDEGYGRKDSAFRIALWNACRARGMSQDATLSLIQATFSDAALADRQPDQRGGEVGRHGVIARIVAEMRGSIRFTDADMVAALAAAPRPAEQGEGA